MRHVTFAVGPRDAPTINGAWRRRRRDLRRALRMRTPPYRALVATIEVSTDGVVWEDLDTLVRGIDPAIREDDIGRCLECGDECFLRYCSSSCAEIAGASDIADDFDLSDDEYDGLERGAP